MPKPKTKTTAAKSRAATEAPQFRLQKFLAQAGLGSRRECEELITEGRVTIGGQVFKKLGTQVPADAENVRVDGSKVLASRLQYYMVHKPTGVLSTCQDPEGRRRVIDLIKTDQRVYNVGRLDKSSEGLILVTNDGDLANRLTHPRYGVKKTYHVTVVGNPKWNDLQQLKRGIRLAEAVAQVSEVKVRKRRRDSCDLVLTLEEGRNREIRRLLAHIGHKVTRLRRVAIGSLQLGNLKAGDYRRLEYSEVEALKKASATVQPRKTRRPRPVETSQLDSEKIRKKKAASASVPSKAKKTAGVKKKRPLKSAGPKSSSTKRSSTKSSSTKRSATKNSTTQKRKTSKKGAASKKRPLKTVSRRGEGRMTKATGKGPASRKKSAAGKRKTAGAKKRTSGRVSSSKGRKPRRK